MLMDYCDSKTFHEHPLFSQEPTALQLILYFDELEVCNPLGSRRKKHKIGMIDKTLSLHENQCHDFHNLHAQTQVHSTFCLETCIQDSGPRLVTFNF